MTGRLWVSNLIADQIGQQQMVPKQQREDKTELQSVHSAPADSELMQAMALTGLTKNNHTHRLRDLEKRPVTYVKNCLLASHFPDILDAHRTCTYSVINCCT